MTRVFALISLTLAAAFAEPSRAQCDQYLVETFRAPSCGLTGFPAVVPQAINEDGIIVGFRTDCTTSTDHAFQWTSGPSSTDLPPVAGLYTSRAFDVNSSAQIVGFREIIQTGRSAFRYQNGAYTELGRVLNSTEVQALAINDQGQICGYSNNAISGPLRAFLWQDGQMQVLSLPLGPFAIASDINNRSQVVGWMGPSANRVAFLWQEGVGVGLGIPRGSISSQAIAINETGVIAGIHVVEVSAGVFRRRAFHWKDGVFTDLGLLTGTEKVEVRGMNDRGEIVGWCANANDGNMSPFIWRDGVMTDLRTLVTLPANFTLNEVWAINDQGQIAAGGRDYNTSPISSPGYRLTPVSKIPGDYDCNHIVDKYDLLGVITHWGPTPGGGLAPADFNRDGTVNVADLLTVIINWTI